MESSAVMKSRLVAILGWTALALLLAGLVVFSIAPRIESSKAPGTQQTRDARSTPRPKWAVQIGRAHVCTPVTNATLVCRFLLETKKHTTYILHTTFLTT